MKILTGKEIQELDRVTMERQNISSLNLMERAAESLSQAICNRVEVGSELLFFIGKGNNGGDGLAMARMLSNVGFFCSVVVPFGEKELSEECLVNFRRLPEHVEVVRKDDEIAFNRETVVVDALLGSGVSGHARSTVLEYIKIINRMDCYTISVDLPSGMLTEFGNNPKFIVSADVTLAIEFPKLAMMLPEAGECCGTIEVIDINLDEEFKKESKTRYNYIDANFIETLKRKRLKFSHKGDYGHLLLISGSKTMGGAAILATCGALRSGCGLVTTHIPEDLSTALYISAPSAMQSHDKSDFFSILPKELEKFDAIGVGPGLGMHDLTKEAVAELFSLANAPMVIDADALNIIAENPELLKKVPKGSVYTPHLGELKRLLGKWESDQDKIKMVSDFAYKSNSTIVVKGAHTMICDPSLKVYFNSTGSPAMAKGGSGDIITGVTSGLLAQGLPASYSAIISCYYHGLAGSSAGEFFSENSSNSYDIVDFLQL